MKVDLTSEELELIEQALREMKIDLSGYGLTVKPEDVERLIAKLEAIGDSD
jgi:hypothetical protein